ncbi:hypothetical protein SRHO_G00154140 [Serrasalmus rhombeus]
MRRPCRPVGGANSVSVVLQAQRRGEEDPRSHSDQRCTVPSGSSQVLRCGSEFCVHAVLPAVREQAELLKTNPSELPQRSSCCCRNEWWT